MKLSIFLIASTTLMLLSCSKKNNCSNRDSLDGTWKMVSVTDNVTNTSLDKPSSSGDVVITFVSNSSTGGTFSGRTPTNEISENNYSVAPNHVISMPVLAMTKVGETPWGSQFTDNIRGAYQYTFRTPGELSIRTITKTLNFKKL